MFYVILGIIHFFEEYRNYENLGIRESHIIKNESDCFFFDLWEFVEEENIEVELTISEGYFDEEYTYIGLENEAIIRKDYNISEHIRYRKYNKGNYNRQTLFSD